MDLELDKADTEDITLDIVISTGDATDIDNFTTQSITIAKGKTTASATVTLTDDTDIEADEDIVFEIQNVAGTNKPELGDNTQFTLTIKSDDVAPNTSVEFDTTSITKNEADGSVDITLNITNPDATTPTSIDVVLTSGDADAVGNYSAQNITFNAGETSKTVTVTISDDADKDNETIVLELKNITGGNTASLGGNTKFTLTIEDDDNAPTNLALNGNFESWTAGKPDSWTTIDAQLTVSQETTIVKSGSSIKFDMTSSKGDLRQKVTVEAGKTYVYSYDIYTVDKGNGYNKARIYVDNDFKVFSDTSIVDAWQTSTYEYTAKANEEIEIGVRFYIKEGGASTFYIDNISFTEKL